MPSTLFLNSSIFRWRPPTTVIPSRIAPGRDSCRGICILPFACALASRRHPDRLSPFPVLFSTRRNPEPIPSLAPLPTLSSRASGLRDPIRVAMSESRDLHFRRSPGSLWFAVVRAFASHCHPEPNRARARFVPRDLACLLGGRSFSSDIPRRVSALPLAVPFPRRFAFPLPERCVICISPFTAAFASRCHPEPNRAPARFVPKNLHFAVRLRSCFPSSPRPPITFPPALLHPKESGTDTFVGATPQPCHPERAA